MWVLWCRAAQALALPIEVDILLIGFDGDGGYGYTFQKNDLEELLGSATGKRGRVSPGVAGFKRHQALWIVPATTCWNSIRPHAGDNTICPTVWDTKEHAAVCYNVNYMLLDSIKLKDVSQGGPGIGHVHACMCALMMWAPGNPFCVHARAHAPGCVAAALAQPQTARLQAHEHVQVPCCAAGTTAHTAARRTFGKGMMHAMEKV